MTVDDELVAALEREIEQLRRRYAPAVREVPGARELQARFTLGPTTLCWHLVLEEVLEPDLDLEITPHAILVRARESSDSRLLLGILAVPHGFDPSQPRVRFEGGSLEVRLRRRRR